MTLDASSRSADDDAFRGRRPRTGWPTTSSASSPSCAAAAAPATRTSASTSGSRGSSVLGEHGWIGLGWPCEHGGRGASIERAGHLGRGVRTRRGARAGQPHGREPARADADRSTARPEQCARFLPGHPPTAPSGGARATASRTPAATSPTSRPRARLDGDEWVIDGQKVWTSLAHVSHWCFVVARTEPGSRAPPRAVASCSCRWTSPASRCARSSRPTGGGEFNETFFDDARTAADLVVGQPGDGWTVAMGLLGFERGISTLAQQVGFARELDAHDRHRPPAAASPATRSCASGSPAPTPGCG